MRKAYKYLSLALVLALVMGVMALAGCQPKEEAKPEEPKAQGIKSVADLKEGDKIGVQSGTTGEEWAKANLVSKGIEVIPYDDVLAAFAALQAGDVVGVINDLPISQDIVKDPARGVEVVEEIKTDEAYGFAFNKANTVLRDAINWGLAEVIASGEYDTIYEKWFGAPPMSKPDVPAGVKPTGEIKTLTAGKILVGSDTAYPPFENVEDGVTVGFDVDLLAAISKKIGLTAEFKTYKFDALITGMQAGTEFDMIASAMTITEKRAESINFSAPYINSNQSLAVKKTQ